MVNESPEEADPTVELMLKLRDGDEAAFDRIVERWQTPLLNFFHRSLGSYEQSEDLTQIVFIRLYRAAPSYQPKARFSTWLFQIARRLLINEYRRSQRKPLDSWDPVDLQDLTPVETSRDYAELEEAFDQVLHKLPEKQRTAILLLKQQELSYQEIADIMNAKESAVKTWIFRARQFLKQELKDWV